MSKFITIIAFAIAVSLGGFGQDAPLQDYIGKFNFPPGSPVPSVDVKVVDSVLIGESQMGPATLKRMEGDMFSILEYNGVAEFKRSADGKVISVIITVDTLVMEGTKESATLRIARFKPLSPLSIR